MRPNRDYNYNYKIDILNLNVKQGTLYKRVKMSESSEETWILKRNENGGNNCLRNIPLPSGEKKNLTSTLKIKFH